MIPVTRRHQCARRAFAAADAAVEEVNDASTFYLLSRIYRQGYGFFEVAPTAPGFRAGLNFVSFQDTSERVIRMLRQQRWLGDVSFGGDAANQPPGIDRLLTVRAAGIYLVPPLVPDEAFPGARILT